jgi:hypothetical protein
MFKWLYHTALIPKSVMVDTAVSIRSALTVNHDRLELSVYKFIHV